MKNFFKILIFIFMMINLCACNNNNKPTEDLYTSISNKKIFVVGVNENSKPFAYKKGSELVGFDVDLIKLITKNIFEEPVKIEFKQVTPSNRILMLNSNEIDIIISTMTITKERKRVIDFSEPYFMSGQALLVKNKSSIRSGKDLNNKKVGIILGTTAADNIRFIAPKANIVGFKNYKEAFNEMKKNNLDAISTDDVILQGIIDGNKNYKILPERYSTEYYGIALRKNSQSETLKQEINKALVNLEQSDELLKLEKKYNVYYRK